jgi:hypothetical protein
VLKKSLISLVVLIGILFLFSYPEVYVIQGSAGGVLYWNTHEALLFMGGGNTGAHMSYPRYALDPFLVGLGDVRQRNDERCLQILVIRVTTKDVQRYDTDVTCVAGYYLYAGQIYALNYPSVWKWTGNRLESVTPQENAEVVAARLAAARSTNPDQHPWEFDNVDGWSMRQFGSTGPMFQLSLDGQPLTILYSGATWPPKPFSVDLTRPGQAPRRIWEFDGEPHRVRRVEYERYFGKR